MIKPEELKELEQLTSCVETAQAGSQSAAAVIHETEKRHEARLAATPADSVAEPPKDCRILEDKELRYSLDKLRKRLEQSVWSRERQLAMDKIEEARGWLGHDLKQCGNPYPYPNGADLTSTKVDPPADVAPTVRTITMEDAGKAAYDAYCTMREWKSYDGKPLPQWPEVKPEIKTGWFAAVSAVVNLHTPSVTK